MQSRTTNMEEGPSPLLQEMLFLSHKAFQKGQVEEPGNENDGGQSILARSRAFLTRVRSALTPALKPAKRGKKAAAAAEAASLASQPAWCSSMLSCEIILSTLLVLASSSSFVSSSSSSSSASIIAESNEFEIVAGDALDLLMELVRDSHNMTKWIYMKDSIAA